MIVIILIIKIIITTKIVPLHSKVLFLQTPKTRPDLTLQTNFLLLKAIFLNPKPLLIVG